MEDAKWNSHGTICIFMNIGDIPWSLVRLAHCDLWFPLRPYTPLKKNGWNPKIWPNWKGKIIWAKPLTPWPLDSKTFNFPGNYPSLKNTTSKLTPWKDDGLERCNNFLFNWEWPTIFWCYVYVSFREGVSLVDCFLIKSSRGAWFVLPNVSSYRSIFWRSSWPQCCGSWAKQGRRWRGGSRDFPGNMFGCVF